MRSISYEAIVAAVREIAMRAAYNLPVDVFSSLRSAAVREESPQGRAILEQCIENATIAKRDSLPICQDTGYAIFFVSLGTECYITGGTLNDAINEGCRQGYHDGYLRSSIVTDPLFGRKNSGNNTPALIHLELIAGDALSITILPKGGGCENMSALAMLKPSDGRAGVVDFVVTTVAQSGGNPCPPVVVGVGIGGTADKASLLAKKALLRPIGTVNSSSDYAELELEILAKINRTGNGPQGLGGTVTALAVHIIPYACHIASLPVAVNLNCHAARQATVTL